MNRKACCAWATVLLLGGCATGLGVVGQAHVEATAHRHCATMPTMEQHKQCLQTFDTTTPKDLRPRTPMASTVIPAEATPEQERQRREALCIRREGQAPLCPN